MEIKVNVSCCLCSEQEEIEVNLPNGWVVLYDAIDCDVGFCSRHRIVKEWSDSQCPGCVEGWQDCGLWRAFAYNKRELTQNDLESISSGICPKRTNGTSLFSQATGKIDIDLSDRASAESGVAFAKAISDYLEMYDHERL